MIDKSLVADGYLFRTHRDRGLYLGTLLRNRPRWLQEHPDGWRFIQDVLQETAPLPPHAEGESKFEVKTAPTTPKVSGDVGNNGDDDENARLTDISIDDPPSPAMARQVIDDAASPSPTESEITIGERRYVSAERAASILKVSVRTFSRLNAAGKGPPRNKIGRKVWYDVCKLQNWLG